MKRTGAAVRQQISRSAEKRGELRQASTGEVSLVFGDVDAASGAKEVRGQLLDRSASGFRAEHRFPGLTCGQVVQFRLPASNTGRARVVWTRIAGEYVESGFIIVK